VKQTRTDQATVKCIAYMIFYFIFALLMGLSCKPRKDFYHTTEYLISLKDERDIIEYIELRSINHPLDSDGNTILHHAAMLGDLKAYDLLLANGANPYLDNRRGETPAQLRKK